MNGNKAKLADEIQKLKAMRFREKREYIWEYYKFAIVVTAFLLVLFGSLINTWFINPPKKDYLFIAWMDRYAPDAQLDALSDGLIQGLSENPEKETITISPFFDMGDESYAMAMYNRLLAMVSAAELDVFIMGKETAVSLADAGYLAALEGYFETLAVSNPTLAQTLAEAALVTEARPHAEASAEQGMYALSLADCPYLVSLDIYTEDLYLGVVVNSHRTDRIVRLLEFIYR